MLRCFLETFEEGRLAQQVSRQKMADCARTFFFPRSLPTTLSMMDQDKDSTISALRLTLNQFFFEFLYEFCIKIKFPVGTNYFDAELGKSNRTMREFPVHRKTHQFWVSSPIHKQAVRVSWQLPWQGFLLWCLLSVAWKGRARCASHPGWAHKATHF